ncbi:MAG: SGNH/GDSL hydrolase family protein [Eubacteriales bacterium]|nr:SGNH/GDSL hydrolase family protein [Eubacteriales bacterium]
MELRGKKINFLGDSITEGHGTSAPDKCFCALIQAAQGCLCRNYGIGGTRIARQGSPSQEAKWDLDFCGRVEEMDPDADIVAVFGGTNDFGHGDAPLGSLRDRTCYTFCGGLHQLYTALIQRYPAAQIVVLTPLHRTNEDNPRGDGNKARDVGVLQTYVEIIRQVAEYYSLPVLDLYACSGLQPKVPVIQEKYVPDGLHPNDAGHEILAAKITAFLQSL